MTRNKKRLRNGESCWLVGSPHRSEDGGSVDIGAECQSAFASKLSPTVGSGTSAETGRLLGRLRWQASSYRVQVHPQNQVGY